MTPNLTTSGVLGSNEARYAGAVSPTAQVPTRLAVVHTKRASTRTPATTHAPNGRTPRCSGTVGQHTSTRQFTTQLARSHTKAPVARLRTSSHVPSGEASPDAGTVTQNTATPKVFGAARRCALEEHGRSPSLERATTSPWAPKTRRSEAEAEIAVNLPERSGGKKSSGA